MCGINDPKMVGPWNVKDKWCVSPYNFEEEVVSQFPNKPKQIRVRDVTLCEGQHQPGVRFTLEEQLTLAIALREAGINRTKALIGNFKAFEFAQAIKKEIPDEHIDVIFPIIDYDEYGDSDKKVLEDMERLAKYGVDELCFPGYNSWNTPYRLTSKYSKQHMLERYAKMTEEARKMGFEVECGPVDGTRMPWEDLNELFSTFIQAGATSIAIYDSYGVITPYGMKYLVEKTKALYDVPVLVHVHADLGSAEASTIAGVLGGAEYVDLALLGLGDRAGNSSLEEVVMQLEMNYGIETGVKVDKLLEACRVAEKVSGIYLPYIKPITGANVFINESEAHASMILSEGLNAKYVASHEAFSPTVVGAIREVKFGDISSSGAMIRIRLEQLGLPTDEATIKKVGLEMKQLLSDAKKFLSLEEFDELANKVC